MIYEVRATLFFETEDPIDDIKDKILDHWPDAKVIKPGLPDQQCSVLDLIKNHHDTDPNDPCELIFHKDNCPEHPFY